MLTHASKLSKPRDLAASQTDCARLLIVRHGMGRGPKIKLRRFRPRRFQPMFDDITNRFPNLGSRFSYWDTGSPLPNIDDVRAILFVLQDPLRETHPDCFRQASELARLAEATGVRIVNDPESLSNTIKSTQSRLWCDAGIPTPPCTGFTSMPELHAAATDLTFPVMIKSDRMHAQQQTLVVDRADDLARIPAEELPQRGVIASIIDTRSGFQSVDPTSPFATHFHKKRAMVFGDHVCHNHIFFADQPIVGCVSSTFGHFRNFNPLTRSRLNDQYRRHFECDLEYWAQEPEHTQLLTQAARVLGVEFCAIDYSTTADGEIFLWEANPYFSLHRWPIAVLERRRKLKQRMPRVHDTAAMFFRDLMDVDA